MNLAALVGAVAGLHNWRPLRAKIDAIPIAPGNDEPSADHFLSPSASISAGTIRGLSPIVGARTCLTMMNSNDVVVSTRMRQEGVAMYIHDCLRSPILKFAFLLLSLAVSSWGAVAQASSLCDSSKVKGAVSPPIILRVALYPYVPDSKRIFQLLEAGFECLNPGVNLELVEEPNATYHYYDFDEQKKRGFIFVNADVYEIDTILLTDFVAAKKLAPLSLPFNDFDTHAVKAVEREGVIYAVPHWMCGNFLFYRRNDADVAAQKTWEELNAALKKRNQNLFVDFKGGLTLGEWYFTALSELIGVEAAEKAILGNAPIDSRAIAILSQILDRCPAGFCRNESLHDRTGVYARAFVRGQVPVYIGYSESIHYGLRENYDNCLPGSGCLDESDIAVRKLPVATTDGVSTGLGWVDALAHDAGLTGVKKELALAFIRFVTELPTYQTLLAPEWPYGSRYLLAARPIGEVEKAGLYPALYEAYKGRKTGTAKSLNLMLRELAKTKVDCALPRDRGDGADCNK